MGNNPLVSVIIPVYKVESFLNRCLRSVVGQSYKELEIILVDDGSPDKCPQMCEQWKDKDKRIKVIHKENGGLSSARNAGMKIMTGDYVCFVDSDDWIEPIMIEHLMEMIRNTKGADIAQCDYRISYKFESFSRQPKEIIKVFGKKEMLDYFFRLHGEKSNTGVWNKVISRNILDGFKFVDTLNEDVEASYEFLTRANKMVITNQVYYHYFVNKEGITNSNFKMKDLQYLSVCDRILERTKIEHKQYTEAALYYRRRANYSLLAKMKTKGFDKNDKEVLKVYRSLKSIVRSDFWYLIKGNMQWYRKILLIYVIL